MNELPDRLLRETLQARMPEGRSPECLDAETVAAWADDTLGRDERRAAEAHAADCVWCQALVAAMARTAPPVAARSWWRAPFMGWLVPLTAAAAAVLVWMNVPKTPLVPSSTMSRAIEQEPFRPVQGPLSNTPPETRPLSAARPEAARVNRQGSTKAADRAQVRAAEKSSTEAPAVPGKALSEAVGVNAAPSALAATPTAPPSPPQQAAADSLAGVPPSVTVQRTAAPAPSFESAKARAFLANTQRPTPLIISPNPASQWRILANGTVQHSTDRGSTWEVQSTGATVMLTAGASPAPSICWLVGREGIVLLSTDGRFWRRVAFPERADLVLVLATDDMNATVTTSDGRAFRTMNGGQTWAR